MSFEDSQRQKERQRYSQLKSLCVHLHFISPVYLMSTHKMQRYHESKSKVSAHTENRVLPVVSMLSGFSFFGAEQKQGQSMSVCVGEREFA